MTDDALLCRGISHTLAEDRAARVTNLRYRLEVRLHADSALPDVATELSFTLADASRDLVLDADLAELTDVRLDGSPIGARRVENHLVFPASALSEGQHVISTRGRARSAASGQPVIRVGSGALDDTWVYSLLVPADSHRLFPCFDQPDLPGRVTWVLHTPSNWTAVTNGAPIEQGVEQRAETDGVRWCFAETAPISTYLMAFAAGPFAIAVESADGSAAAQVPGLEAPLRVLARPALLAGLDTAAFLELHRHALAWLADWTDTPYPYGKLDLVLLPGFPYGGMEHAGAIAYREDATVFDGPPDAWQRWRRSTLVNHELAHQWFGNLVTMRWFDDLWIKEGFATYLAHRILDEVEPEARAWLRFRQLVVPAALRVDGTQGSRPTHQPLENLADAKALYGPAVYNRAPALLRMLERQLGEHAFRGGARRLLARHAHGSADWRDVVKAMEAASGEALDDWAAAWLLDGGMPSVTVTCDTSGWRVEQDDAVGRSGRAWPLRLELAVRRAGGGGGAAGGGRERPEYEESREDRENGENREEREDRVCFELTRARPCVERSAANTRPVELLLPDPDGALYGRVVLDVERAVALARHLPHEPDALRQAQALEVLTACLWAGTLRPRPWADALLETLGTQRDAIGLSAVVERLGLLIERVLHATPEGLALARRASGTLRERLAAGDLPGCERVALCAVVRWSPEPAWLQAALDHPRDVLGVELPLRDRFELLAGWLALGSDEAIECEAREAAAAAVANDGPDLDQLRYVARAARPDSTVKAEVFASWTAADAPPEPWVHASLAHFHWPGQQELTRPFLERGLALAPWIATHRRIFLLPAWLEAFVGAYADADALACVQAFAQGTPGPSPELLRKLHVPLSELGRVVDVREAFLNQPPG